MGSQTYKDADTYKDGDIGGHEPTPSVSNKSSAIKLSEAQKLNWLQLYRSENVGPATFRDLINHFGNAAAALEALPELSKRGGAAARIKICSKDAALREMEASKRAGAELIAIGEGAYSPLLRRYEQAPPLISAKGNTDIFAKPGIGIVGSRNSSIAGQKMAERFASGLGQQDYAIISGLARGIDTAAHRASLATGTVAVFAGGVDVVFPDENATLAQDIIENGGALISEMPIGWKPRAKDFPRRNRIITGLSLGILVIEAAKRSGSLITARLANEAGRLVFAVPGSPLDPRSAGANHLIKQGAILAADAEDVLEALSPLNPSQPDMFEEEEELLFESEESAPLDTSHAIRQRIINALGPSPVEIDDIIRFSNAPIGEVQLVLLELSIAGRIERHGGNRISLIS